MDYVIGDPPYVRIHNPNSLYGNVRSYSFAGKGMTDLYMAFFEIGFNMMDGRGRMCYITPNSWLTSKAAEKMRQYIVRERNLMSLTDLEHFQAFGNVTTYTIISLFSKNNNNKNNGTEKDAFDYYRFNGNTGERELIGNIPTDDSCINSCLYLSDREHLSLIRRIKTERIPYIKYVTVKNGLATPADNVFMGKDVPHSTITTRVLKASNGRWHNALYPYDEKGKLLNPDTALADPTVREYLNAHKEELLKGGPDLPTFYGYGRTQALTDTYKENTAINNLARDKADMRIEHARKGEGVYGGYYIIANTQTSNATSNHDVTTEDIERILMTDEFMEYVRALKKYKSGGYYTFNTKDAEQYINTKLNEQGNVSP